MWTAVFKNSELLHRAFHFINDGSCVVIYDEIWYKDRWTVCVIKSVQFTRSLQYLTYLDIQIQLYCDSIRNHIEMGNIKWMLRRNKKSMISKISVKFISPCMSFLAFIYTSNICLCISVWCLTITVILIYLQWKLYTKIFINVYI